MYTVYSCGEIGRQNLDDDLPVELGLGRDEYARHSCTTELTVDVIGCTEDLL
ncbi:MAG TPA: hypothetical protein VJB15_10280 [Rhodothermia bacterium]|nr:hypothetical protein [Rhodothermia bacterium]